MYKFLLLYFNHMAKYFSNVLACLKVSLMVLFESLDGIPCCNIVQHNIELIHSFDKRHCVTMASKTMNYTWL